MSIENILPDASSAMTVISLITFIGILWWTFSARRTADFDAAAHIPFADDADGVDRVDSAGLVATADREPHHV